MKKGTSTHSEVFIALAQAYEVGNTVITERIESILTPNELKLPDQLQTALDTLGDTPIAAPEAFSALEKEDPNAFTKACSNGVDLDAYDAVEAGTFIARCRNKILSDVDKDGVFKTTPNLDKMRLPKLSEVRKYSDMAKNGTSEEDLVKHITETIGLGKAKLTEWEQSLVKSIITSYTQVTTDAFIGKVTDRTPFARYLKNI